MAAAKHSDAEILAAVERFGKQGAADHLGVKVRGLFGRLQRINARGKPFDPPAGFNASAVSTLHDADGNVKLQWVKSKQGEHSPEEWARIVKDAFADTPRVAKIAAPKQTTDKLLTVYPMGDPHIGMFSHRAETGADFDLKIAEQNLTEAVRRLIAVSPDTDEALICNVGDFYHSDTQDNITARSGHHLDVDTRWSKILRVGVRTMRACIEFALAKHKRVRVINEIGNHDDHTSQMLTLALELLYEKNPRVSFDSSPAKFHYHVFGQNLFGVTHGDTVKPEALPLLMASDKPAEWGASKFRYWLTGHIHTRRVFEQGECLVESFRTLAARDAWTASMGYRSGRDMYAITYHKDLGEVERHRIDVAAL